MILDVTNAFIHFNLHELYIRAKSAESVPHQRNVLLVWAIIPTPSRYSAPTYQPLRSSASLNFHLFYVSRTCILVPADAKDLIDMF